MYILRNESQQNRVYISELKIMGERLKVSCFDIVITTDYDGLIISFEFVFYPMCRLRFHIYNRLVDSK